MNSFAVVVGSRVAGFELGILCRVFGFDRSDDGLAAHDFAICGPRPGLVPTTSAMVSPTCSTGPPSTWIARRRGTTPNAHRHAFRT